MKELSKKSSMKQRTRASRAKLKGMVSQTRKIFSFASFSTTSRAANKWRYSLHRAASCESKSEDEGLAMAG